MSSVEHGDDHLGSGESVPQGDSPKEPYIKYGCIMPQSRCTVGVKEPTPSIIKISLKPTHFNPFQAIIIEHLENI